MYSALLQIKEDRLLKPADAFLVIFSVVDKNSFETAEMILKNLQENEMLRSRPAILVGNKVDMARSREVSTQGTHCIRVSQSLLQITFLKTNLFSRYGDCKIK